MPVYAYTAIDPRERRSSGTITADTPAEGRQRIRDHGLRLVRFAAQANRSRRLPVIPSGGVRRKEQVAEVARYLSLLLRAGVPLAECLEVLTRREHGKLTAVLKDVRDRLTGGTSFADSLALHGGWFDVLFISAVRVGELTGNLDDALAELAEHLQTRQRLHSQVTSALTYPAVLCCVGVIVVLFLMSYVVPQLLGVLEASDRPLPASTMLLKSVSDTLISHWLIILLAVAASVAAVTAALRNPHVRRNWHRLQLRLPLAGSLIRKRVVADFARQMSLLLGTGVPFVDAARTVAGLTSHRVLAEELGAMADAVESGSDIAPTMADSRIFPPVVTHLVAVGQDSGDLTQMLAELKKRYESEVQIALGRFTAALEPALIVVLASAVGFVVFACLMPILETTRGLVD